MRITNRMMTNNMLSNINKNKQNITSLEEQYSTGKKIQKPSDDPIVTVRALKLRTSLSELEQYVDKNIPDAQSWMDVTESALDTVNDILRQVNTYCVQGSSDTLTASDRSAIVENLEQMRNQIYQEGNANYAGRYLFTGYKTDSSLIFTEDDTSLSYSITENFSPEDMGVINKITGSYEVADFNDGTVTFTDPPVMNQVHRLQLSYDQLDDVTLDGIRLYEKDSSGELVEQSVFTNITTVSAADEDAYLPDSGEAHFIYETGEIILGSAAYEDIRKADGLKITYDKTEFSEGDLKPEHYFDCVMKDLDKPEEDPITFTKTNQEIQYEINYNQKLTINTQGSDAISHQIGRRIEDIIDAVNQVILTEDKIAEVENCLEDQALAEAEIERYTKLKEQLDTELDLKKEAMQQAFEKGITASDDEQDRVNTALADLGSRYNRLELTENRLSNQKVDFEDLLSKNEDVDIAETIVKYTSAENIYNASLSAASKVVKNTLLDFL